MRHAVGNQRSRDTKFGDPARSRSERANGRSYNTRGERRSECLEGAAYKLRVYESTGRKGNVVPTGGRCPTSNFEQIWARFDATCRYHDRISSVKGRSERSTPDRFGCEGRPDVRRSSLKRAFQVDGEICVR